MKPGRHVQTAVCFLTEQAAYLPHVLAEQGSRQCSLMHARSSGQSGSRVHSGCGGGSGQDKQEHGAVTGHAVIKRVLSLLGIKVWAYFVYGCMVFYYRTGLKCSNVLYPAKKSLWCNGACEKKQLAQYLA